MVALTARYNKEHASKQVTLQGRPVRVMAATVASVRSPSLRLPYPSRCLQAARALSRRLCLPSAFRQLLHHPAAPPAHQPHDLQQSLQRCSCRRGTILWAASPGNLATAFCPVRLPEQQATGLQAQNTYLPAGTWQAATSKKHRTLSVFPELQQARGLQTPNSQPQAGF